MPPPEHNDEIWIEDESSPEEGETTACPHCGNQLPMLGLASFSFNKPAGACPRCTGLGVVADLQIERVFDLEKSVVGGGVLIWDAFNADRFALTLQRAGDRYKFDFDLTLPIGELGQAQRDLLYYGVNSQEFVRHFPNVTPPTSTVRGRFEGVITNLRRRYSEGSSDSGLAVKTETLYAKSVCSECNGTRLRKESRQVSVAGRNIVETSELPLDELAIWIQEMKATCNENEMAIARPVVDDLERRIQRLVSIGVGYLSLERATPSLSAGENQRLRLASLLGSGLTGVLYVLDEPTIGLHQRDTAKLIGVLRQLRDLGNTVVVIEHDLEMIRAADYVVEFGPAAGKHGGQIVAEGSPDDVASDLNSPTGAFLSGRARLPLRAPRKTRQGQLIIKGAGVHNLKTIDVAIPLGQLVAVVGVSGSGKSSLIFDILEPAARDRLGGTGQLVGTHKSIEGWQAIGDVITIDQMPIGRVPRSNAATYTEVFKAIREVYATLEGAKSAKLSPRHFSFNVAGGRCERCEGAGTLTVNMHFLPDAQVRCPACKGRRYKPEVLAVRYKGVDIASVLDLTVEEALALFATEPPIAGRLRLMTEVGLGYLQLGQPATTLSGGEAQRVKLAKELGRNSSDHTLYLLDEPTTGLHPADIAKLLIVLQRLVDEGNSVLIIEHNVEIIAAADWLIELGPEGGRAGGYLIAEGTPQQVSESSKSPTARYLSLVLRGLGEATAAA
ncbi:MAG: excinuclease ABC subunit UvrA [Anaerolineales bacterium]